VQDPPTCRRLSNSLADVGSLSQSGLFNYIPTGNVERLEEEKKITSSFMKKRMLVTQRLLWYDMEGCFSRSRVAFQFEFCVSVSGIDWRSNCPLSEICAVEKAMQTGLRDKSEVLIFEIGDMLLTNVDGEIKCIGQFEQQEDKFQKLRGGLPLCHLFAGCFSNMRKSDYTGGWM
jgi:hypothetical protein